MNKEKILREEKEYWQAEALKARELKARELEEQHAAATRKAREEIKVLEEFRTESIFKLAAITNLADLCEEYGKPMPSINYNTASAIELRERAHMAYDVSKLTATTAPEPAPEYILMAWRGNGGGYYTDTRALSKEDSAKFAAIARQNKIALYAKVVK